MSKETSLDGASGPSRELIADAEKLCWELRKHVSLAPADDKLCYVRFTVGVQTFTLGADPLPEDEASHYAGLFVLALAGLVRTTANPDLARLSAEKKALAEALEALIAANDNVSGELMFNEPDDEDMEPSYERLNSVVESARAALSSTKEQA
jgi:hypothetical protein